MPFIGRLGVTVTPFFAVANYILMLYWTHSGVISVAIVAMLVSIFGFMGAAWQLRLYGVKSKPPSA